MPNASPEQIKKRPDAPSGLLLSIIEYFELFAACLCVILLLFSFGFRICTVSGTSMLPTLEDGQLLLTSNLFYEPKGGDIVVFHQTSETVDRYNEPMVKRVIATEGQHVRIDFHDKTVIVDGVTLDEKYIQLIYYGQYTVLAEHHMEYVFDESTENFHPVFEATVPQGCLFVMGDNRNGSADSRTVDIGFVDARRLLGKAICRLTPFDQFGTLQ